MEIVHKINGEIVDSPKNWKELQLAIDFLSDTEGVDSMNLEFAGDIAKKLIKRIKDGMSGGVGIFEGDQYEIVIDNQYTFKGYLDYADGTEVIGCNEIDVSLKKDKGNDWLNDIADSFSFRYLESIGVIKQSDFVKVPYVINYVPDNAEMIMLSISIYILTKEIAEAVKSTADTIAEATSAATPTVGVSVSVVPGVVTSWDLGDILLAALKITARVAYTIAMVIALKKLIEELMEQIMPKKKYHLGMSVKTLFQKGCEHLGLKLSSKLLDDRSNWIIIPSKGGKTNTGVPSMGDVNDTFGGLIREWSENFYADYKIINGVFKFERADYWDQSSGYTIPNFFNNQSELKDVFKPNSDEIVSNYNIYWNYDVQDQNTLDNQDGRVFQVITEPIIEKNKDYRNIKGFEQVILNASIGERKNTLTKVESTLKSVAKLIDKLTGIFGKGTSYASKIEGRIGALSVSSHFLTIPKVVVMSGSNLANNQRDLLSAKRLWNDLHYISSFAEINGIHNQWLKYENLKVPFCLKDYLTLIENNYCKTVDGETAMIENVKWKVWENTAEINFRIKQKYTNNLKLKFIE